MLRQVVAAALAMLALGACQQPAAAPAPAAPVDAVATSDPAGPAAVQPVAEGASSLGVTFNPGPGLTTAPCEGDTPRCVTVSDPTAEPFLRELFTVQVRDGPLDVVAAAEAGFVRNDEGQLMTTHGRFEPVPVEPFTVHGNPGLRASITCGISDPETGFHAGAGECVWAVVSDGRRSVVIVSSGYGNAIGPANATIASVRFPPRP